MMTIAHGEKGERMAKSKVSDIGHAVLDLIEEYNIAKEAEYVRNPVAYALYHTWRKYDTEDRTTDEE